MDEGILEALKSFIEAIRDATEREVRVVTVEVRGGRLVVRVPPNWPGDVTKLKVTFSN